MTQRRTVRLSPDERKAAGKAMRTKTPRSLHGEWQPAQDRADPITLLEQQSANRDSELIPIRYGRMRESPFAFYRGAAAIMAADLASAPVSGIQVQACGDCHLLNFGAYSSPERDLIFDLNHFDETLPAPWEWDVKRLAASFVVAGRRIGISEKNCRQSAREAVRSYRDHMAEFAEMKTLEVWYAGLNSKDVLEKSKSDAIGKRRNASVVRVRTRTVEHAFPRLKTVAKGERKIIDEPPLIYHPKQKARFEQEMKKLFESYRETLPEDRQALLDRYHPVDFAMKVVGVGNAGTRCAILLMLASESDPLLLQIKQGYASVLEPYAGTSLYENHGQRIVVGQRLMQTGSDLFLGWTRNERGEHYYVRQLREMRISPNFEGYSASDFIEYAELCGWALARAHAKAGDAAMISGYLGKADSFDTALGNFAVAYADQTEKDHVALTAAVKKGLLSVHVKRKR